MRQASLILAALLVAVPVLARSESLTGHHDFTFHMMKATDAIPGKRITVQIDPVEQAALLAAAPKVDPHPLPSDPAAQPAPLTPVVPAGAMRQWTGWCKHPEYCAGVEPDGKAAFARATFPVHTVSFTDDEFMTAQGTEAMLACYTAAVRRHTRVTPADWSEKRIGHFNVFRKEMAAHWPRMVRMLDELPGLRETNTQA